MSQLAQPANGGPENQRRHEQQHGDGRQHRPSRIVFEDQVLRIGFQPIENRLSEGERIQAEQMQQRTCCAVGFGGILR